MKTTMDADTILFIGRDGKALALAYSYYSKHYSDVPDTEKINDPIDIFYKCTDSSDSWIDFQRAIQIKQGGFQSRINQAYADVNYRIDDLTRIPQTKFYDARGFIHEIGPYDGTYDGAKWSKRTDLGVLSQGYDYDIDVSGNHLFVTFKNDKVDLVNSFISLNGLFYPFTVVAGQGAPVIKFNNVIEELSVTSVNMTDYDEDELNQILNDYRQRIADCEGRIRAKQALVKGYQETLKNKEELLENPGNLSQSEINIIKGDIATLNENISKESLRIEEIKSERSTLLQKYNYIYSSSLRHEYAVKVRVYSWEHVIKSTYITPKERQGEWFKLNVPIDDNCIIIYKGQILQYEVSSADNRLFRLDGIDYGNLSSFEIGKIQVYQMKTDLPNSTIQRYVIKGHANKHKNTVDFVLPIKQSLILYEGIDHEYEILDSGSIMYSDTTFGTLKVSDTSNILSINFTRAGQVE